MRQPMLAQPGRPSDLEREGYLFEPKLDGTRALCYKDERISFINRRGREISERYPELELFKDIMARSCVLDGEIVVFDSKGNPDFHLLQKREHSSPSIRKMLSARHPATYVAFDILEKDGRDLVRTPLNERRRILQRTVTETSNLRLIVASMDGKKMWELAKQRGIEGVMAKRMNSVYDEGRRSPSWIKVKTTNTLDCVIVGYTSDQRALSSLGLGLYDGRSLIYIGKVGTGFTDSFLLELKAALDAIPLELPSVVNPPQENMSWARPELVCEVEYLEITSSLHLRAPAFRRLREDKSPDDCVIEQIRG